LAAKILPLYSGPNQLLISDLYIYSVSPGHGKSWNLVRPFSGPGKSLKMSVKSWNFYNYLHDFLTVM